MDLVPLDVEDSPDCAMVEGFQLFFIPWREAPCFATPEGGAQYEGGVNVMLCSDVNIFVTKKCLVAPSADFTTGES